MPIPRSPRALFLLPACALLAGAATSLAPAQAHAKLPGWGIDGTPGVDDAWCHGAGRTAYVGDFNGDARDDLLCHNSDTGRRRIDFGDAEYSGLWGTDWDSLGSVSADDDWCTEAGSELHVGDFNGDGRDDLLCRVQRGYTNAGRKQIDFADGQGLLEGTDFDSLDHSTAAQTWCTNAGESVYVGDFNGDGKDDLLCHVARGYANAGRKRIDFANGSGSFFGTEFNSQDYPDAAQTWCTNAGESLRVGDYNGDHRDDLLCFVDAGNTNAGRRRVDFANGSGTFFGTEFNSQDYATATQSWCVANGDELHVGDVNGDDKDDLLCANRAYGYVHVDHANSAGTFFGTNGDTHSENWCTNGNERFQVGDFDGDGKADLLCHDDGTGYRGMRYANDDGDFHSICSDDSFMGDGSLPDLPVHFSVVSDPAEPRVPARAAHMPAANSSHVDPFDGSAITNDPTTYFEVEVDLMNDLTQHYNPNSGWSFPWACWGSDCIGYDYDSHTLYDEIGTTSCGELMNYGDIPDVRYAGDCMSHLEDDDQCYPNACDGPHGNDSDGWIYGFACAIRSCDERELVKPHTLNVVVMDRCFWDETDPDGINDVECGVGKASMSFGFNDDDFFTGWDYGRMLRGRDGFGLSRPNARGLETHELGHVLGLGHTQDCTQFGNAMHKATCKSTGGLMWRESGYSTDVDNFDQLETMISDARARVVAWSCN